MELQLLAGFHFDLELVCGPVKPPFTTLAAAYQLHFYLCFKTYCLKPMLARDDVQELVKQVLDDVCSREEYHLLESDITESHLRLLISMKPAQTVSRAVKMLKGNLAHEFASTFKEQLERHQSRSLWAKGYFARSSGKVNLDLARQYVEQQVSHHGYEGEWTKALKFHNNAFKSPAFEMDHCFTMLNYHVVLATQNRIPLFDETIAQFFFDYVTSIGRKHNFVVDRMGLLPDHMHLIIEAIPNVSVEECVLALLNNTQCWMEKHYSGVLKQTGAWNVWRPSFYAGTVGEYSTAQVKRFLGGN